MLFKDYMNRPRIALILVRIVKALVIMLVCHFSWFTTFVCHNVSSVIWLCNTVMTSLTLFRVPCYIIICQICGCVKCYKKLVQFDNYSYS